MKVGLLLQAVDAPRAIGDLAREVEDLGYEHLLIADSSLHARDVYPYLTLALANTSRLRIGTGVTHPYTRHPAITANVMATLAELGGDRVILGVGAGDRPVHELGLPSASRAVMRSMIETCRALFAGETISREGDPFTLDGASLMSPPASPPSVWLAASGPRTLRLGGEMADGIEAQIGLTPAHVEWARRCVAEGAAAAGKQPPEFGVMAYGSVRPQRDLARHEARFIAAWFAQTVPIHCTLAGVDPDLVARIQQAYQGGELHEAVTAADLVDEIMLDALTMSGSPDDIGRRLGELEGAGVQRVTFMPMGEDRWASIRLFANIWKEMAA